MGALRRPQEGLEGWICVWRRKNHHRQRTRWKDPGAARITSSCYRRSPFLWSGTGRKAQEGRQVPVLFRERIGRKGFLAIIVLQSQNHPFFAGKPPFGTCSGQERTEKSKSEASDRISPIESSGWWLCVRGDCRAHSCGSLLRRDAPEGGFGGAIGDDTVEVAAFDGTILRGLHLRAIRSKWKPSPVPHLRMALSKVALSKERRIISGNICMKVVCNFSTKIIF